MDGDARDGLILICAHSGIIEQVLFDGLELTDKHTAGQSFTALVLSESMGTASELLHTLQADTPAFDWVLNARSGGQRVILHALGYSLQGKLIVIGAQSRTLLRELYHHMLSSHHRELNGASGLAAQEHGGPSPREQALQAQVEQMTDQLNTLQLELAHKPAERPQPSEPQGGTGLPLPQWLRRREQLLHDLSACEEARITYQQSSTLYSALFHDSPVALFATALGDGRIVDANGQFEQMLGYSRDEMLKQPAAQFFAPASREALVRIVAAMRDEPGIYDARLTLHDKEGAPVEALLSVALVQSGAQQYVVHTLSEASETKGLAPGAGADAGPLRDELAQREAEARQLSEQVAAMGEELSARVSNEQTLLEQVASLLERADSEQMWRQALEQSVAAYTQSESALREQVTALEHDKAALADKEKLLFEQVKQFVTKQKQRESELLGQVEQLHARERELRDGMRAWEARDEEHLQRIQALADELGSVRSIAEQRAALVGGEPAVRPVYADALARALGARVQSETTVLEQLGQWGARLAAMTVGEPLPEPEATASHVRESDWLSGLTGLRDRIAQLGAQLGALQTRERDLLAYIDVLESMGSDENVLLELEALRRSTSTLEREASEHRQTEAALDERVRSLSDELEHVRAYDHTLESEVRELKQRSAALGAEVAAWEAQWQTLEPQLQAHNADLAALNDVARLALDAQSARAMLGAALKQVGEQFGAAGCYALRWDEREQRLVPTAATGLYADAFPALPSLHPDLRIDDPALFAAHSSFGAADGVGSTLSLPLLVQGARHGLLLITVDRAHDFQPTEIERAERFAAQLAMLLAHWRTREAWRAELAEQHEQQEQLRQLTLRLAEGEELAQQQLASQLQRRIGQSLTMLSVGLEALPNELSADSALLVTQRVAASQKLVVEIGNHVRDVIAELYPPALDDGGLVEALRWYSLQLLKSTGLRAVVLGEPGDAHLEPLVERVLFRIAQRTLSSASQAPTRSPVYVTLSELADKTQLRIAGDGAMLMDTEANPALLKVRARATAIGGVLRIDRPAGQLTQLTVDVPHAVVPD